MTTIDTADHVRHRPSGQYWLVAFVENGHLCACGWPCELVPLEDCELVQKAAPGERDKLLRDLAAMGGSDPRRSYAVRRLAEAPKP